MANKGREYNLEKTPRIGGQIYDKTNDTIADYC